MSELPRRWKEFFHDSGKIDSILKYMQEMFKLCMICNVESDLQHHYKKCVSNMEDLKVSIFKVFAILPNPGE